MGSTIGHDRRRRFRPPGSVALIGSGLLLGGLVASGVTVVGDDPRLRTDALAASAEAARSDAAEVAQRAEVAEAAEAAQAAEVAEVAEVAVLVAPDVVWPRMVPAAPNESASPDAPDAPDEAAAPDESGEPGEPGEPDAAELELTTASVQQRLRAQKYLVGPVDGEWGQQTEAAVMAFQQVHGLEVDGVVGPLTTAALVGDLITPVLRGGPDDRIEVDLSRQLLHLVEGGARSVTLHVSSGNGTEYVASSGNAARANTPVGEFELERRIHGLRQANLGILHDPMYFHRGFAIHGAPSVPATPASLGCVRVTIADGAWLIDRIPDGMAVHLYGGEHVYRPPGK